jgi:mannose-6-phosphate isomerase class I
LPALKRALRPEAIFLARDAMRSPEQIDALVQADLGGDDPVFGRLTQLNLEQFFDPARGAAISAKIASQTTGLILVYGTGATLLCPGSQPDILVYADMARWEIQMRQRRNEIGNFGVENRTLKASLKYKRAYFIDWRVADRHKRQLMDRWDFVLDTNKPGEPKLVTGEAVRAALRMTAARPFRVVPFFDPGPWGGQSMKEVCDLDRSAVNFAWCFDCVPEENSLLLDFGEHRVELPSIDLVFHQPQELLGSAAYGRFGAEFPIRFDFLDTMGGGNLSLQVHPLTEYIRQVFHMSYTQDESYYMLDAEPDASVYLGFKEKIDRDQFLSLLQDALANGTPVPDEKIEQFINRYPAKKHDHFLIPAGTIHCSGRGSMVLEISATPYIFTFKLWDWGRVGLDGKPRPIHLDHGRKNLQFDRTTDWVGRNLINRIEPIAAGNGWREERTGLHESEFIETRRHWFTSAVAHSGGSGVNVLNLVEGEEVTVESPTQRFEPFVVHYAETFIVPAAAGAYTIRPSGLASGKQCATMKAFVRENN